MHSTNKKPFSFLYVGIIALLCLLVACNPQNKIFEKAETTGVDFVNTLTESDDFNIIDYLYFYNGGGVAVGDINGDGWVDIYLSGNQVKNKLYLNKGNLQFEDITDKAGVAGASDWNTGAVMADVNGDGLLDIYVCAVVGIRGSGGHNELFINNGDLTFTEKSAKYGLDFDTYSSSAAFLDYDKDGDLDMFLLNHAVHTQESFGHANLRHKRNYETGDKLLRNDGQVFTDVSEEAGVFGGVNGYGLGVAVADFNQDGFPDIYVGNDFHEDDYYYVNNGNGTFSEKLKTYFGHTSRFSMGNDVADINHDGLPDLLSLDMLAEDEKVVKSSEGDEGVKIMRLRTDRYGYHYQFARNMLHINQGDALFAETALLSGIAATDWSWSALFADYNQDGEQDLFISNGIPKRPNDLDYIKFVSNEQVVGKIGATKLVDQQALDMMPSGAAQNYLFLGARGLGFEDKSAALPQETLFATATAYADLDNDGDLDLVINNVNDKAGIYQNQTDASAGYLKIYPRYKKPNSFAIGTKVYIYNAGEVQYKELYTVRGYQASSEPVLHFGVGQATQIDSLKIIWPDNSIQMLYDVPTQQSMIVVQENARAYTPVDKPQRIYFERVKDNMGIHFSHREDPYIDFDRQALMPYQVSDRGPATAMGDLNGDGRLDVYFGSSKFQSDKIYLQTDSGFEEVKIPALTADSVKENVAAAIADFDNNGKNDILMGSGGADFYGTMPPLLDSYFVQSEGKWQAATLPAAYENASVIAVADYDQDGDIDVFVGNQAVTGDFGKIPACHLLINDNGNFVADQDPQWQQVGMVTDAIWHDYNADGLLDLVVVGEWMAPTFYSNVNGKLVKDEGVINDNLKGLWQAVIPFDIDADGDDDLMLGNWGTNTKFIASEDNPMVMYYHDFDQNGSTETILATHKNGNYYTLAGLDELAGQLVYLRKKYNRYQDFAGQTVEQIFGQDQLKKAATLHVHTLASGYLQNNNGKFSFQRFGEYMQVAPIMAFVKADFDSDGQKEVFAAGNYFGVKPYHGRYDGFSGALIKSDSVLLPGHEIGIPLAGKSVRAMFVFENGSEKYLLVTVNNASAEVYKLML